jgi:hypothetical protein
MKIVKVVGIYGVRVGTMTTRTGASIQKDTAPGPF